MKKTLFASAMVMALAIMMILPGAALAELTNSGKITENLNPEKLEMITLKTEGLDVEIKKIENATPFAELDATVIGINAEDVSYDLQVTENDEGTVIEAHHTGSDIGINHVKLYIYVPEDVMDTLALDTTDTDVKVEDVRAQYLTGNMTGGKLHGNGTIINMDVTTAQTDIDFDGSVGGLDVTATGGRVKVISDMFLAGAQVTATDADVEVKIPEDVGGFTVNYTVTEGKLNTNFVQAYSEETGSFVHGDGTATYDFTVNNGTLKIEKK